MLSVASPESMPDTASLESSRRNRSIRLAVITSFVSKAGTILLQAISIPIAIRVLGKAEFGLFTTVNLTLSTLSLLEVGIGPALTHGLSQALSKGDETKQRELGSTAFFLVACIALMSGLILGLVLLTVPLPVLFGADYSGREGALRPALWTGLAISMLAFCLNLTARIREGFLEVAFNNIWGAAGNVMAAITLGLGVWIFPEVWFLFLSIHGSMLVMKTFNTVTLWKKHPLMIPSIRFVRSKIAKFMFSDGIAFSACCVVPGLVEFNFFGWLIGWTSGAASVGLYGIFITLTIMQLGFVVMISTPTWPAVAEALARNDKAWAFNAAKRLYLYGTGFAVCSALGLVLVGPWVLPLWLGKEFSGINRILLGCYGLYFIAHVWRHLNHTMMIGTGQVGKLLRIQLFESCCVAILGTTALQLGGLPSLLATAGVVILLLTGSFLPRQVLRLLKC